MEKLREYIDELYNEEKVKQEEYEKIKQRIADLTTKNERIIASLNELNNNLTALSSFVNKYEDLDLLRLTKSINDISENLALLVQNEGKIDEFIKKVEEFKRVISEIDNKKKETINVVNAYAVTIERKLRELKNELKNVTDVFVSSVNGVYREIKIANSFYEKIHFALKLFIVFTLINSVIWITFIVRLIWR